MPSQDDYSSLHRVDKVLCELSYIRYNYTWLTPLNIREEFERFIDADSEYNPQFRYRSFSVKDALDRLDRLDIPDGSRLCRLFERTRQHFLAEARALDAIGTDRFDTSSLFGPIDQSLIARARDILSRSRPEPVSQPKTVSPSTVGSTMLAEISSYGLHGWTVEYDRDFLANASISSGTKTIRLKEGVAFTRSHLDKLLVHEIGTHVLRMENGLSQPFRILAHGLPGYLSTEEGLAGYNERLQGVDSPVTEFTYALRALATSIASTGSFVDVYREIRPFVDGDYKAFLIATRAKRGLGDTSKPGGYLKDHCYLEGKLLLDRFVREGGDVSKLYVGKIGVGDLWLVDEGFIDPPRVLPRFLE